MDIDLRLPLFYIPSIAGLVMVATGVVLVCREKIFINEETKQVTEIETPLGKFRTNIPAIALFVTAFIPMLYPLYHATSNGIPLVSGVTAKDLQIKGKVTSPVHPVDVYVIAGSDQLKSDREFSISVPKRSQSYLVLYAAGDKILDDLADPQAEKNGQVSMLPKEMPTDTVAYQGKVAPIPEAFRRK